MSKIQTLVQITRRHVASINQRRTDEKQQVISMHAWATANKHALEAFYFLLDGKYLESCATLSNGLSIRILYCNFHKQWRDTTVYELAILTYLALTIGHMELFYQSLVCLEKIFESASMLDNAIIVSGIRWLQRFRQYAKARHLIRLVYGRTRL